MCRLPSWLSSGCSEHKWYEIALNDGMVTRCVIQFCMYEKNWLTIMVMHTRMTQKNVSVTQGGPVRCLIGTKYQTHELPNK